MSSPYTRFVNRSPRIPVLAHIPHSSTVVPACFRSQIVLTDQDLHEEVRLLTDWFTEELYHSIIVLGGSAVISDLNRFVIDTERFEDDSQEVMAQRGMGVIYRRTTNGEPFRREITEEERAELISHYRFHHQLLTEATESIVAQFGFCIVVDRHSYPERALPYELNPGGERPDVCIGTDSFHTPLPVYECIAAAAREFGYSVTRDTPFSGALVPMKYYRQDARVKAVMLEVNRAIYMDETVSKKSLSFGKAQGFIRLAIKSLSEIPEATLLQKANTNPCVK